MRLVMVLAVLLIGLAVPFMAHAQPDEAVLIDQHLYLSSGMNWSECVTVERGVLTLIASSPPGRSGETARLLFLPNRQTVRPNAYLSVPLALDDVVASHAVEQGSYCYHVMISNQYPDPHDPSGPERSHRQVVLKVTHEPS